MKPDELTTLPSHGERIGESTPLLRELIDIAEDAVVVTDESRRVIYLNRGAERVFGYVAAELVGTSVDRLIPDGYRARHAEHMREFARGNARSRAMRQRPSVHGRRADGTTFPAEVTISKLRRGDGWIFAAVVRDISERQAQDARFRALVEGTSRATGKEFFTSLVSTFGSTMGLRFVLVAELVAGERTQRLRTHAVWERGAIQPGFQYDLAAGTPCDTAMRHGHAAEACMSPAQRLSFSSHLAFAPCSYLALRLDSSTGEPLGLFVAASDEPVVRPDVSEQVLAVFAARAAAEIERSRTEAALRRTEEGARSIFEGAPHGIVRVAADGRVLDANRSLARILGYTDIASLAADAARRETFGGVLRAATAAAGAIEPPLDVQWTRVDGTVVRVRLTGRILGDGEGDGARGEIFVEDITEQHALEESLRHAQKMDAIGQLTGGIAHDFNNLLTVVQCSVASARDLVPAERGDLVEELEQIDSAARRGAEMIRKLMVFSRRSVLEQRAIAIGDVVQETSALLRRVVPSTVDMQVIVSPSLPPVRGDATAVQQAIINLAMNAVDAMPNGGSLVLRATHAQLLPNRARRLGLDPAHDYVAVSVVDSGTGMSEHTIAHAFEPFFTTKPPGRGTGLGLSMVFGLMQQLGGTVELSSAIGVGTTVHLYLAAETVNHPAPPDATARDDEPRGGSETILVIDDEPGIRKAMKDLLEGRGYSVLSAADGREALDLLARDHERVSLVISDIVMPFMDGVTLGRHVTEHFPGLHLLLYTGCSERPGVPNVRDLDPGVVVLQKPMNPNALLAQVRRTLDASAR